MQVVNLESVLRYIETTNIEGAFVETGTYTGGASAYAILALLRLRKHKAPREYYGFDSFEGRHAFPFTKRWRTRQHLGHWQEHVGD